MDTKIIKIQTAIFTKNFNVTDDAKRAQLLLDIDAHTKSIFNVPPVQVPIPNEAPQEFPRIILNSNSGKYGGNIALSRSDILFNVPRGDTRSLADLLQVQQNNVKNIFDFLISQGVIINRIGFIAVVTKELSPGEGSNFDYLKSQFVKEGKFNFPKELMFRYNFAGRSGNFDMNNLITINSRPGNIIIITTDINTVAEIMTATNFSLENFNEVINYAIKKTQELIDNFPNI